MLRISRRRMVLGTLAIPYLLSCRRIAHAAGLDRLGASNDVASDLRVVYAYSANGALMTDFWPNSSEPVSPLKGDISPYLAPLSAIKERVTVFKGLTNPIKKNGHDHATASFLTCVDPADTPDSQVARSIDLIMADLLGQTPIDVLNVRMTTNNVGSKGPNYFRNVISYLGPKTPNAQLRRPEDLFARMFPNTKELTANKSILDAVVGEIDRIKLQADAFDRHKLEEYLDGIRTLEREFSGSGQCSRPAEEEARSYNQIVDSFMNLIFVAFQCNISRVAAWMWTPAGSYLNYGFLNVSGSMHGIAHDQESPEKRTALRTIYRYYMDKMQAFAKRLQSEVVDEDGGTLLDKTLIWHDSEVGIERPGRFARVHSNRELPIVLIGGGCGFNSGGKLVDFTASNQPPTRADLHLQLLKHAGYADNVLGKFGRRDLRGEW